MTIHTIVDALGLPTDARVDQRVSKKLLVENGAPTSADKRHINDEIVELFWVAALQPHTVGIPEYRDAVREYLEVEVLSLSLRSESSERRVVELVHRAIPYPVLLIAEQSHKLSLSVAHKRRSQGEAGKTVLDDEIVAAYVSATVDDKIMGKFLNALALSRQPQSSMLTLYNGWMDTLIALQAAFASGTFVQVETHDRALARRDAIQECAKLERQITALRAAAKKEKQTGKLAGLNLDLKRLQAALDAARSNL